MILMRTERGVQQFIVAVKMAQDMYPGGWMDRDTYPTKFFAQHTYTGRSRKDYDFHLSLGLSLFLILITIFVRF